MKLTARMFHCAGCHCQVIICRHCDRGNVYCTNGCADHARSTSLRRAAKRYRLTRRGRHSNADRQREFRARQKQKVTHQGSPPVIRLALLLSALNARKRDQEEASNRTETAIYCHFCQRECDPFLRRDFLRPPQRGKPRRSLSQQPLIEGEDH